MVQPGLQLSHSLQVLLRDHGVELLVLLQRLFSFVFNLQRCLDHVCIRLLNLFLGRCKLLEGRHRAIAQLSVHHGLHLRLFLNLLPPYSYPRVLTPEVILAHLVVLRRADESLPLPKDVLWQLE